MDLCCFVGPRFGDGCDVARARTVLRQPGGRYSFAQKVFEGADADLAEREEFLGAEKREELGHARWSPFILPHRNIDGIELAAKTGAFVGRVINGYPAGDDVTEDFEACGCRGELGFFAFQLAELVADRFPLSLRIGQFYELELGGCHVLIEHAPK
jgi:hypothetical protein